METEILLLRASLLGASPDLVSDEYLPKWGGWSRKEREDGAGEVA